MKNTSLLLTLAAIALLASGCVATQYQKTYTVTKDANGNVISTVETESIVQPQQQGYLMKMDHFKNVQPGNK